MPARTTASVLLLIATLPVIASAQLPADTAAQVDKVFAAIDRTDAPGCVLGVNRGGQPLYRRGYGMASLELGVPLSEHSVLESGSVAKQFTAGAIVNLAVTGKLNLDEPARKYLPELPDYAAPITIRMLLNHTSGIRDMWTLFTLAGREPGSVLFSMDQALQMVFRQREPNFPPNSQYLYSNSGYLLLAEIVKRVSGKPLADYSRENFFEPLGMSETQWRNDWNRVVLGRATAYHSVPGGWQVDMPFMSVYGAGGLFLTVGDALRWNDNLDAPRIGGQAWVDSLQHRGRLTSGKDLSYALGLLIGSYRGDREVSHTGATGGYRTYLARFPDRKVSVAVLCNYGSANPEALGHRAVDALLGRGPAEIAATGNPGASSQAAAHPVADYVGQFKVIETEELVTFSSRDGHLVVDLGAEFELTPSGSDRFRGAQIPVEAIFQRSQGGAVESVELDVGGEGSTRYRRTTPPRSAAAEIRALAGSYYSDELDVRYSLKARDTTLVLEVPGQSEATLVRTGPDSFGGPRGLALRFLPGKRRPVTGFLLFAGRVRNLRFVKR